MGAPRFVSGPRMSLAHSLPFSHNLQGKLGHMEPFFVFTWNPKNAEQLIKTQFDQLPLVCCVSN